MSLNLTQLMIGFFLLTSLLVASSIFVGDVLVSYGLNSSEITDSVFIENALNYSGTTSKSGDDAYLTIQNDELDKDAQFPQGENTAMSAMKNIVRNPFGIVNGLLTDLGGILEFPAWFNTLALGVVGLMFTFALIGAWRRYQP